MAEKYRPMSLPEVMLVAGTRVALGAGIGLLLSQVIGTDRSRAAGWALLAVGGLTSIPLVAGFLGKPVVHDPQPTP